MRVLNAWACGAIQLIQRVDRRKVSADRHMYTWTCRDNVILPRTLMLLMAKLINSCSSKARSVCHPWNANINDKGEHSNCRHEWHGPSSNLRSNAKCRIKSGSSYLGRYDLSYMALV
jgi:hypothetical protein